MWSDRRYATKAGFDERQRREGTYWLLGITIGTYALIELFAAGAAGSRAGIHGQLAATREGLAEGRLWQPLTSIFVHQGFGALLLFMLVLFSVGRFAEGLMGTRRFVALYLGAGALGALTCLALPGTATLGSGAAVLGIVVAAAVVAPETPFNLLFFSMPLKWVALLVAGADVVFLLGRGEGGPGSLDFASPWSHAAGAATGLVASWFGPAVARPWLRSLRGRRSRRREVERIERQLMEERELDRILDKIAKGGMASLSESERRFLQRVSNRYQGSRPP